MKINIEPVAPPSTFEDFAAKNDLTMIVSERSKDFWPAGRWYASFRHVETKHGGLLRSEFGNGSTPTAAIADYAKQLEGKLLVYKAMGPDRREIQAPTEWRKEDNAKTT